MKFTLEITDNSVKLYDNTVLLKEVLYDNNRVSMYDALRKLSGIAGNEYQDNEKIKHVE